ncbi:hypothetical protein SARC_07352 [Sphaeroforma arctica JP610]|uniref:GST N-terminal domain-containing protein n=1 Tax=Sphaeroforma arctica JP610 TaxID=667725 RepID=A0A0L0FTY8_9EUKA|nr:hypothetical protein SARC_07352 [Sphaeroforma arctica JP610]KNC80287.1 hypothetical protein SARC_07352 [Sphaeroforma arctica JP610]|eukprot:XP_014154189.1 hypothetical protein SARC_07352 [Sphaeroforma arctica JP610]
MAGTVLLFHFPPGVESMVVRQVLEAKDVAYEDSVLNTLIDEDIAPWYIEELNENADVPTLVHGKKVITDVHYICSYIEKNFPEPSVVPTDATQSAENTDWTKRCLSMANSVLYRKQSGVARYMTIDKLMQRLGTATQHKKDNPALASTYDNVIKKTQQLINDLEDDNVSSQKMEELEAFLDELDLHLKQKQNMVGGTFTLADTACIALLRHLEVSRLSGLWVDGKRRNIARYYRRQKGSHPFGAAIEEYPMTLDLILPSLVSTGKRMLHKKPTQTALVGVAAVLGIGYLLRGPSPNAPIMVYF